MRALRTYAQDSKVLSRSWFTVYPRLCVTILFLLQFWCSLSVQSQEVTRSQHKFSRFSRIIVMPPCIPKTSVLVLSRDISLLSTSWMTSRETLSTSSITITPTCCLWTTDVMDTPQWKPSCGISWRSTSPRGPVKVSR